MLRQRLLPLCVPALLTACSNNAGTASVDVRLSSTSALALSADDAASGDVTGAAVDADPAGAPGADALILHVVRTEAKVTSAAPSDGDADAAPDADDGTPPAADPESVDDAQDAENEGAADEHSDEDHEGWSVISEEAREVDLLAAVDDPAQIAAGDLPAGKLSQLRLVLAEDVQAELVVADVAAPVRVPSGSQSGFKVIFAPPLDLVDGESATITLEVAGTVERGNGTLQLRPTLRAASASDDNEQGDTDANEESGATGEGQGG